MANVVKHIHAGLLHARHIYCQHTVPHTARCRLSCFLATNAFLLDFLRVHTRYSLRHPLDLFFNLFFSMLQYSAPVEDKDDAIRMVIPHDRSPRSGSGSIPQVAARPVTACSAGCVRYCQNRCVTRAQRHCTNTKPNFGPFSICMTSIFISPLTPSFQYECTLGISVPSI